MKKAQDRPKTREKLSIPIEVRLNGGGNLTIEEVCALATRCKTGFYADLKAGRVAILKLGRKSVVPAAIARAYLAGEPLPERAA